MALGDFQTIAECPLQHTATPHSAGACCNLPCGNARHSIFTLPSPAVMMVAETGRDHAKVMTTEKCRNILIGEEAGNWQVGGRHYEFGSLGKPQAAFSSGMELGHPEQKRLEHNSNDHQEESGRSYYYFNLLVGWALFILFPIKSLVPFFLYSHLLMLRTISLAVKPDSGKNFILWTGFMGLHLFIIVAIVAGTHFAMRLPVGSLAWYGLPGPIQY